MRVSFCVVIKILVFCILMLDYFNRILAALCSHILQETFVQLLIKISWKQPKIYLLLIFDLYQRPSSEEAGTRSSSSSSWRDKLESSQESGRTYA